MLIASNDLKNDKSELLSIISDLVVLIEGNDKIYGLLELIDGYYYEEFDTSCLDEAKAVLSMGL